VHRGDLIIASSSVESALRKFPDSQSEWHWRFWALKGEILMMQGRYEESLTLLNTSLPAKLASSDIAIWQKLSQGAAWARVSKYEDAANSLAQADLLARQNHPELLGEVALRQGILAFHRGDTTGALSAYRAALRIAQDQKNPFLEVASLGSLGLASTRLEHYDESIDWNKRALQLSQSLGDSRSISRIKGNVAWSYHEMGDLENALAGFEEAQLEAEHAGLVADRIYWLNSAAGVSYDLGDFLAAESSSQRAIALAKSLKENGAIIECLQNLALVALARGKYGEAQSDLSEATQRENPAPDHARQLYTRLISAHLSTRTQNLFEAEHSYSAIARDAGAPTSLRWEALASLAEAHAAQGKSMVAEREFGQAISTIAKVQRELEHEEFRLSFLSSAIRFYNVYVDFLIAQHRPSDALAIAERSRAQTLTAGLTEPSQALVTSFPRVDVQQLAARFHSTLLFYSLGTPRSHLWVITPQKTTLLSLPAQSEINSLVKSYRDEVLDSGNPLESPNSPASKLYSILVQPAAKLIPRDTRVILFPDGALNSLNFETLIVPGPLPHYWIQDVTVTTANSLTLLQRSQVAPPPQNAKLLLVGDAISSDEQFPPLRQASREMDSIKGYFTEDHRRILAGKDATPAAYLSAEPERFDYLHFVTHGTASSTHPLDSAVILTKAGDSEKLYAHEIVTRPLHAYLVTVSACDGTGKRTYAGEGLVGLSWAFLRAGAHNVIASLWEVSDDSTPKLMDELYKGLRAGQDPATALRNAKLSLVHSEGNFRKPFYWAPFQLYAGS
jgi:CHAT domain-containing protein/tetratricopeptide (TPR) repeat protein